MSLVHRSPVIAQSLVALLAQFDIDAVALAWNGMSKIKKDLSETPTDVLLLDPAISSLDPGEVVHQVEGAQGMAVSMMAVDGTTELLDEAVSAGASGFVSMDTSVDEFIGSLMLLSQGNVVATTSSETTLADIAVPTPTPSSARGQLSGRELEITEQVAQGHTNREIGEYFELTEGTIKVHLRNIFRKLNISNRAELASFAHVAGIVGK